MFAWFKWEALFRNFDVFLEGLWVTVSVSLTALVATLAISLVVGLARTSGSRRSSRIAGAYMSFFQNTPLVVQVLFLYNALPRIGIMLSSFAVGSIGLALYTGAFGGAVVEAAIRAVPKGQTEAALSQGFSHLQSMVMVIIPQAMRIALPPMANQLVNLIKNSSIMAMVAGGDLMYRSDSWASGNLYYGPSFIVTGLLYLALCLPLSLIVARFERMQKGGVA
ncbi:amino acid ABC transporter permease [Parasphaerochaeta coccoides]|uniref:Amino acid ABC transporter membrane protein 1, PAAT family n=1 Tax=Parasphaerochaeta coccoides (strain ATCC BAA-1237 / DSM 17374 / SPN1) TaxID=760011 RepID=F4GI13_PARC1|nr:amino acid ABC transporter permease [Parasphaerochaeta coccoides]AEC02611.1 amino acid ABC transporter membrane protein 1, PAAT family [Parasphaerochaeta coccoides DSM 17374]